LSLITVPWQLAVSLIFGGLTPTPARITTELLPAADAAAAHLEQEEDRAELAHAR
jgi:hypothetical protein